MFSLCLGGELYLTVPPLFSCLLRFHHFLSLPPCLVPVPSPKQTRVRQVFDLPFDKSEEQILVSFLKEAGGSGNTVCQNLLILFLTNRNRYVEAIQEHERFVERFPLKETSKAQRVIIENLKLVLPRVQSDLVAISLSKREISRTAPVFGWVFFLSFFLSFF